MDFKNKDEWVAVLRSGKYSQQKGFLKGEDGYCCLGVYYQEFIGEIPPVEYIHEAQITYNKLHKLLPNKLTDKAIKMNDSGSTFNEIADMIEQETWNTHPFLDTAAFSNQNKTIMKG